MKVVEKTDDRLTIVDTQLDKKLGIAVASAFLLYLAYEFAISDGLIISVFFVLLVIVLLIYLKRTLMSSTLSFDHPKDEVVLVVKDRTSEQRWDWKLSDIETAELSEKRRADEMRGDGKKRPVLVLKDGTRVPIRPYHSAGGQSFDAVAAIQRFLGQEVTGAPVGWIPDED